MIRYYEHNGHVMPLAEIAKLGGMTYENLYHRVVNKGLSVDEALATPVKRHIDSRHDEGQMLLSIMGDLDCSWEELANELPVTLDTAIHWSKRGVPAKYAYHVAEFLGCEPYEISRVYHA